MTAHLALTRDCHATKIPEGDLFLLPSGTPVLLAQSLGGAFTVEAPSYGGLFRIAGRDADALGLEAPAAPAPAAGAAATGPVEEGVVWESLKSCYDPEIPVNIVDLGLVYDLKLLPYPSGGSRVEVTMTLTAPGCGMGPAIAADAQQKIAALPGVAEAEVKVVWDPPWSWEMMSDEGKKRLGLG